MELTNKDALRKPRVLPIKLENGDTANAIAMTGDDRWNFSEWSKTLDGTDRELLCAFLSRYLCDQNGTRIYSDQDSKEMASIPSIMLYELFEKVMAANGMGKAADAEAKKS